MKYRTIALFVAFLFACIFYSNSAAASVNDDYIYSEQYGQVVIDEYVGDDMSVDIPATINDKPVTKIGTEAFRDKKLTKVTIPNTVTEIQHMAFRNNKLKEVIIPSSVKRIGNFAFQHNELTSITFENGIEELQSNSFSHNKLTTVTLPASLKNIGMHAFVGNYLNSLTFKGAVNISSYALDLTEIFDSGMLGWFTDKTFKKKWNNKVTGPITLYANWEQTALAKKVKIDNLNSNRVKLTNLKPYYTYTLYKDAALTKKLITFDTTDKTKTVTIKNFGTAASSVYVVVTYNQMSSPPQKINYTAAKTIKLNPNNVTVKYGKKSSTIQLKGLKVGTTYHIYRNSSQKVKIASFKATKTTRNITTNKLVKNYAELYITAQAPKQRLSNVTIACYPKNSLCPKQLAPNAAPIKKRTKDVVTYSYTKKLPGGGKTTEVKVYINENGGLSIIINGVDQKGKSTLAFQHPGESIYFSTMGGIPTLSDEAYFESDLIANQFRNIFINDY